MTLDFNKETLRDEFVNKAMQHKLLILGCGEKSIRFRPHLTVSIDDIDKTFVIIRDILKK